VSEGGFPEDVSETAMGPIFTGHEPVRVPSSLVMSEKVKIGPTAVSG
jgi:hypothetical protein